MDDRKERDKELVREYLKSKRTKGLQDLVERVRKIKDDEDALEVYDFAILKILINEFRKEGEDVSVLKKVCDRKLEEKLKEDDEDEDLGLLGIGLLGSLLGKKSNKKETSYDPFNDYEEYNYEEEELEDDDYYFDDDE